MDEPPPAALPLDAPFVAGREEEIAEAGAFFTHDASGVPVLVTRDLGGRVHALRNVCMHRGARLVLEGRGTADRFVCSLHAWTYDLCGRLGTLPISRCASGEPRQDGALAPLPSALRHGFVWVSGRAGAAIDVAAHLGAADEALAAMQLARLGVHRRSAWTRASDVGAAMTAIATAAAERGARVVALGAGACVVSWAGAEAVSYVGAFARGRELAAVEHALLVAEGARDRAERVWEDAERAFA